MIPSPFVTETQANKERIKVTDLKKYIQEENINGNSQKKVLKNGLRVITGAVKDNPAATVLVLVESGSKYETKR